jgi:hypothetical protein
VASLDQPAIGSFRTIEELAGTIFASLAGRAG